MQNPPCRCLASYKYMYSTHRCLLTDMEHRNAVSILVKAVKRDYACSAVSKQTIS